MACNLAVAITAAVVENEELKKLLKEHPEQLATLMKTYLTSKYPEERVIATVGFGNRVDVRVGYRDFTLRDGVAIDDDGEGDSIFEEVKKGLALAADRMLAEKIASAMKTQARYVDVTTKAKKREKAYQVAAKVRGVDMRVLVMAGGQLEIFADNGSFDQAKASTAVVIEGLQASGVPAKQISAVEQHRAGGLAHAHVNVTHKH